MKPILVALGGVVVGAAAAVAIQSGRSEPAATLAGAEIQSIVRKEQAPLQQRLDELLREVAELKSRPEPARVETPPAPPLDPDAITRRLDALQEQLDRLAGAPALPLPGQDPSAPKPTEPKLTEAKRLELARAHDVALDRARSDKERIDALKKLRGRQTEDGKDARTHDVVVALLDLAENSQSEDSRLDVYRNLHGTDDTAVRDSMLRALAQDSSAKVRKKVAEDIDTYLGDPQVVRALQAASDGDADGGVRGQAWETLHGKSK